MQKRYEPAVDSPDRLILRDGSVAALRAAQPSDAAEMRLFFDALSPSSRYHRFFTSGSPRSDIVARLCDSRDPRQALTLVVERTVDGARHFVGVGSYTRMNDAVAEVAFAVIDEFQGRGIATALLEHLSVDAARQGFSRFHASTLPDNAAMLEVFRQSGFEISTDADRDTVEVEFPISPTSSSVSAAEQRERLATVASIRPLLEPHSVAVIGASRHPGGIGRRIFDSLSAAGFRGPIYPVNADAHRVATHKAFSSVRAIGAPIDLAIVAVPERAVLSVVDDCAAAGVKGLVIITAGFAEAGEEGRAAQAALLDKVRGYGMRMIGPNCMGVLNTAPDVSMNGSFSPIFPPHGRLALSSQSGALGVVILELAGRRHAGLSSFVSVGNKADVSSNDLLLYWRSDPNTSVIALYLESFGNPRRFARLAREIGRVKPIIAVKAGRSRAGSKAASSHTAALAASEVAVAALFQQTGVIRADTIDEMFDVSLCLDAQPLPAGNRVAIVTNAGGPGILATDACEAAGLSVVELSPATRATLQTFLPSAAAVGNPVDMIASAGPDEYRRAIETVLSAPEVDALIVLHTPVDPKGSRPVVDAIRAGIVNARSQGTTKKPIVACLLADPDRGPLECGRERVPSYEFPENAARALGKVVRYARWRAAPAGVRWAFDDIDGRAAETICRNAQRERPGEWLSPADTRAVLEAYGLPTLPLAIVHSAPDAVNAAASFGFPVVAKLVSSRLTHKSDIGAVKLNLRDTEAVSGAFDALEALARDQQVPFDGVLVEPMAPSGIETMMGVVGDRLFGPVLGFGLGGTDVEIIGDVRFRVVPLTDRDVDELVNETRVAKLLAGYRGRPAADRAAVRSALSRLSSLAEDRPEIAELDLNPVIVLPEGQGCRILDARIRIA